MGTKPRKTRSDCTVGSFEKSTVYQLVLYGMIMVVILEVIKK